ncbi:unnamed protein product [Phytophthora fragariaefolia]|uniref:Unnamed protein product n=1 Tax=Phytophthora fragariaefolia TaxID=1490495 RepID=A0A9W6YAK9_9STRA|nr:unnamed protein product [Phytophthora fragariaefolia]
MSRTVEACTLAFIGPAHASQLTDFEYVEVLDVKDGMSTLKVIVPDDEDAIPTLELLAGIIRLRLVSDSERKSGQVHILITQSRSCKILRQGSVLGDMGLCLAIPPRKSPIYCMSYAPMAQ